jgi:hypothetical protein
MTKQEFEKALDENRLWIREHTVQGRKNYLVKRNGRTKTWTTKGGRGRWEVPIKWKQWSTARINQRVDLGAWFTAQPGPSKLVGEELLRVVDVERAETEKLLEQARFIDENPEAF